MLKHILLAGAALIGSVTLGATVGHATVFGGTAAFADNGPANNGVNFSAVGLQSPFATGSLTAGQSQTFGSFATIVGTDNGSGIFGGSQSYTDQVSLTLTFTAPGSGVAGQGGSATETTSLFGFINSGTVTWGGTQITDKTGTYTQQLVTFADGAQAYVDFYDTTLANINLDTVSGNVAVRIVDVADAVAVSEPGTLALLGSGLLGVGFIASRRRKSDGSLA